MKTFLFLKDCQIIQTMVQKVSMEQFLKLPAFLNHRIVAPLIFAVEIVWENV